MIRVLVPAGALPVSGARSIIIEVRDDGGTLTDPATLTVLTWRPDGRVASYTYGTDSEVSKTATGRYAFLTTYAMPGRHAVRVETTTPDDAGQASLVVNMSVAPIPEPPAYQLG